MIDEAMKCTKCGSYDEWQTCLPNGQEIQPEIGSAWDNHYRCGNCSNIQQNKVRSRG